MRPPSPDRHAAAFEVTRRPPQENPDDHPGLCQSFHDYDMDRIDTERTLCDVDRHRCPGA